MRSGRNQQKKLDIQIKIKSNQIVSIEDWVKRFFICSEREVKAEKVCFAERIMNDFICLSFFLQFLWINFGECLSCRREIFLYQLSYCKYICIVPVRSFWTFTHAKYSYLIDFFGSARRGRKQKRTVTNILGKCEYKKKV